MERVINTTASMRARLMPEQEPDDAPNMVDTNAAPGAIDEDGELDDSPAIRELCVVSTHPAGSKTQQTDITVGVFMPHGWQNKRKIVTGGVTVKQLTGLLKTVRDW